ncbi:penicillin-binding protein 2 [Patescibacteria group bacterium]
MSKIFLKEKGTLNTRFLFIYIFIIVLFGVLIINLINLQIVEGNENLYLSSTIKTSEDVVRAPRGLIYDRDGNLLVINRPSFNLVVDLHILTQDREKDVVKLLSTILDVDEQDLWSDFKSRVYDENDVRTSLSQIVLLNDVERDKVVSISSRNEELPGIFVEIGTTREYTYGSEFAHVLGYIREVSSTELEDGEYYVGDTIGAVGLESYYDSTLRGINGKRILETDRDDTLVREFIPIDTISGKSIKISIDSSIQMKLTEILEAGIDGNNADGGSAVIMDVTNGEILSLVSLPTYNSNDLVKGLSLNEYLNLSNDPSLPLYNRAVSMTQPPGSTFKTIVGAAALEEGVINTSTILESEGCMDLGAGYEFCEVGKRAWGKLNIYDAYERSSNIFFAKTLIKYGIDKLGEYTDDFGLGQKTGIDLIGEQGGIMASKDVKQTIEGEPWYLGDTCNTAIGQSLTKVSPVQMVSWMSAIANGGTVYKPHLAISVIDENGEEIQIFEPEVINELSIDEANLKIVREGMYRVVNGSWGSAWPLRGLASDPAAKTGSAEALRKVNGVFEHQGHSWVTGFFPYENPRYAFVVYLEFGGWGYKSAEVMKEFLTWYESEYKL